MRPQELFEVWAPPGAPWSDWAKPSLFAAACPLPEPPTPAWSARPVSWAPSPDGQTALIVDLPGAEAVSCGLSLVAHGFRPVPMMNTSAAPGAVIALDPVLDLLRAGRDALVGAAIPPAAPPAFLLDSRRLDGSPRPGDYDNRWAVYPQDFPSSALLRSRGVERVTVARAVGLSPRVDLLRVLSRWERDGIALELVEDGTGERRALRAGSSIWSRARMAIELFNFGLHRTSAGGFGGRIAAASGGFG